MTDDGGIWKRLFAQSRRPHAGPSKAVTPSRKRPLGRSSRGPSGLDPVPLLREYDGPWLTVSTPAEGPVEELHELVPGVDHESVEGTSHWISLTTPTGSTRSSTGSWIRLTPPRRHARGPRSAPPTPETPMAEAAGPRGEPAARSGGEPATAPCAPCAQPEGDDRPARRPASRATRSRPRGRRPARTAWPSAGTARRGGSRR